MIEVGFSATTQKKIEKVEGLLGKQAVTEVLRRAGEAAGVAAEGVVKRSYPPKASGRARDKIYTRTDGFGVHKGKTIAPYKSRFVSAKQQGFVMMGILSGELDVPYRRTGSLIKSITYKVIDSGGESVTVRVGTNRVYAPDVIGSKGQQSAYHAGTWTPMEDVITGDLPTITRAAENGARTALNEYLKR